MVHIPTKFQREPEDCRDTFGEFQCQGHPGHSGDHFADLIAEYINMQTRTVDEKKGRMTWPK